jgi:PAS domain S-box-containing protein
VGRRDIDSKEGLFGGPGEIRALCRAIDWSATSLGPPERWPGALRLAVRMCLEARFPMAVWAGPERVLIYNEGYPPVLGPARHPWALGRPGREVWAEFWDRLGSELEQVVERGQSTHHEDQPFVLRRGEREEEAYFTYSFNPIQEDDGRIVGALNVFLETTQKVRALQERTALLHAISDASLDVIYAKDLGGRFLFANPSTLRLVGQPGDRVLGRTDLELLDDKAAARKVMENDRQVMVSGGTHELEERIPLPDGTHRIWHSLKTPYRDAAGRVIGLLGISRDITERKQEEETFRQSQDWLKEERARLQAILDTLPVGLFILDAVGGVLVSNEEGKRIWAGSVPTHSVSDFARYKGFWPDSGQPLRLEDWPGAQALQGRRTKDLVVDIEKFDGSRGTIVLSGAPILDGAEKVTGAVVAMQDISELRAAQARLLDADRRKDDFLAMLSHELRNPLTPVKNSLHILARMPPGGEQARRAVGVIERQIDQLSRLVDDLLDVTRITQGKIHLRPRRAELNELVQRTFEDHRTLFERAKVDVQLELAPGEVFIHADPNRVAQVLGNLLQNAAKFTPEAGRVRVKVSVDAQARQAVLAIADSGPGIAAQMLEQVFEPFIQLDTSLDRARAGLGLGLALVKGLVEQHGGTVSAHSEGPGRGAEFVVRLPLDAGPRSAPGQAPGPARAVRRRVLIIEDNFDAADSLREVLEFEGHEVAVARDGPEGIVQARAFRPELVLCDIGLPGMDGYAVAQALRAEEGLSGVSLVALTGYARDEDLQRAREAGFDHHLAKPPSIEKIERLLRELPRR